MAANGSKVTIPQPQTTGPHKSGLHFKEYNPEGRETVVLLHDLFHNSESQWSAVRPFFPGELRLVAVDLPGHGNSPLPESGFNDTPRQFSVAISQWMTQNIRGACHIVAAGLGAYAALHLALGYPQRVASLTLAGFLHHADASVRAEWTAQRATWNMAMQAGDSTGLASRYQHDHWQQMNLELLDDLVTYPPHTMPDDFERLEHPLLIVAGDGIAIERWQALQIRDWSPQGQLAIIPGAGHNAMLDAPGIFGAIVSRFLRTPTFG